MGTYTITEVHGSEEWGDGGEYGPKTTFKLSLDGPDGKTEAGTVAELAQKRESPAPLVGQTLNGQLVSQNGRWKFKKDKPQAGGGVPRQRDPLETKRIVHQHSQEMALRYIEAKVAAGEKLVSKSDPEKPFTFEEVAVIAKMFRTDVEGVS